MEKKLILGRLKEEGKVLLAKKNYDNNESLIRLTINNNITSAL